MLSSFLFFFYSENTVLYSEEIKEYNIAAEYTSLGLLIPSKASHTLAQTMEDFQGDYLRLGFRVLTLIS